MKKIISLVLAVLMLISVFPISAFAAAYPYEVYKFEHLKKAIDSLNDGDKIDLNFTGSPELTEELEIKASDVEIYFHSVYSSSFGLSVLANRAFKISGNNVKLYFDNFTIDGWNKCFKGDGHVFYITGDNCLIKGLSMIHCGSNDNDISLAERAFNSWCGGAIDVDGENCRIENCYFKECWAQGDGGAIYIDDEGCVVSNCTFTDCFARSDGGAIYVCNEQTNALIIDCKFYGYNQCESLGQKNNVYAWDNATVVNPDPYSNDGTLYYGCTVFTEEEYEAIKAAPGKFVSTIAQGLGKAFGFSSTFSKGNGWIVAVIGGVAVIAVAAVVISKKKKKAAAETAEETAEKVNETEEKEE